MANTNSYMNEYMKRRYKERRAKAIEILGGKCVKCGSTENLQFDHTDPKTKGIPISKMWSSSAKNFARELIKCQLLCDDCHKEKSRAESWNRGR